MQVNFLKGSQSSLNTLISNLNKANGASAVAGAFYLTEDTNRLYFAQSSTAIEALNQWVHIWDSAEHSGQQLPSVTDNVQLGDIYYLKQDNILAIYTYKDGTNKWVQLNPDTYLKSGTTAISVKAGTTNSAVITTEIKDENNGSSKHTASGEFSIIGGTNVSVASDSANNAITISATDTNTTYSLSAATTSSRGVIRLTGSDSAVNDVMIAGSGGVSIAQSGQTITISGSNPVTGINNAFSTSGEFVTTLTISGANDISSTTAITPTIVYGGTTATQQTAIFDGTNPTVPIAQLKVYTTTEVDALINNKLASADAMTFKGVVANETAALTNINATGNNKAVAGDVYKSSSKFIFGTGETVPSSLRGKTINIGDLLIATGTDSSITWDIIPSGDDQFINLVFNNTNNSLTLKDTANNANNTLGSFILAQDTCSNHSIISVTSSITTATNEMVTVLKHGAPGASTAIPAASVTSTHTQGTGTNFDVPIVTSISKDEHGHVSSINLDTYRFKDTHATLDNIAVASTVANDNKSVEYSLGISLDNGVDKEAYLLVTSSNLKITELNPSSTSNNRNGFDISFDWGTF